MHSWHKWLGIVLAALLLLIACTGILLIQKKNVAWLQPPTQKGAAGNTPGSSP
jgi:uncharacterized iron-regulated membrane protein